MISTPLYLPCDLLAKLSESVTHHLHFPLTSICLDMFESIGIQVSTRSSLHFVSYSIIDHSSSNPNPPYIRADDTILALLIMFKNRGRHRPLLVARL